MTGCVEVEPPAHLGWWPGGALDALDNALSLPVLRLELGALEYLVAVPGTWFGMPPLVWLLLPQFVGLAVCKAEEQQGHVAGHHCEEGAARGFLAMLLVATALSVVAFFHVLLRGDVHVVFTATKFILLPAAVLPPVLARYALGARAGHAVALVICSWLATETFSHLIKITARRMRPGVALRARIAGTSRRLPQLQRLVLAGETAFQAFPSGDAGGAFVFSYLLYLYQLEQAAWWVWMPALLSSFGRVYLHAHHVIDVVAGCFTGYLGVALVVARFGLESGAHELHTALFMLLFVAFHLFARKRMAFAIPAQYQAASLYGHSYDAAAAAKKH